MKRPIRTFILTGGQQVHGYVGNPSNYLDQRWIPLSEGTFLERPEDNKIIFMQDDRTPELLWINAAQIVAYAEQGAFIVERIQAPEGEVETPTVWPVVGEDPPLVGDNHRIATPVTDANDDHDAPGAGAR